MASAKRFYLCNLIPLCEIDDDHLEVDWTKEEAKNGEIVEMRVVVKDLDLNMTAPDFTIEFEVNENDVLLFGGLDDRVVTITNKSGEEKTEQREISIIGENDVVPADQRLKSIFLSPLPNAAPQKLIRAFWLAAWQDDVAGEPEYYFDVKLEFTGKTFKERSDRELTVSSEAFVDTATVDPTVPVALTLPAVGWSLSELFAEQAVDQLGLLDPSNTGKPVSFVITPDENASLLWILLIPKSNDVAGGPALIKNPWTVARFLPLEYVETLSLKATIEGNEIAASTVDKAQAETFPGQTGGFFARLNLNAGRPQSTPPDPALTVNQQQQQANALLIADSKLVDLKKTLDKELATWATANNKNITPTHPDYAINLLEFSRTLTHDSDSNLLERPASGSALTRWKDGFQKSYLLALMIMSSGDTVDLREEKANNIGIALAEANFVAEALNVVSLFATRERQRFIYDSIVKDAQPTAEQWTTVLNFLTAGTGTLRESELHEKFGFWDGTFTRNGAPARRLLPSDTKKFIAKLGTTDSDRTSKLDAITTTLINAYANDPDLLWALSGLLFFHKPFRQPFSDRMWNTNQSYLLFKILMCDDFIEPDTPGNLTHDGVTLTMEGDMPWVYQNKQRFAVDFLRALCERAGSPIAAPATLTFAHLQQWLEAQTENIAMAAVKVYPDIKNFWFDLYSLLADVFFYHAGGSVRADPHGHIDHLRPGPPNNMRMEADCDVFAAYGARILRAMGFTPIGYLGILPFKADGSFDIGHVEALLKKDDAYFVVNNQKIYRLLLPTTEAEAVLTMRDDILDVLDQPKKYEAYYAPSDATGGMSPRIRQRGEEIRREDLEKNP
jgi:hypothetical protein